jgi:hypothetical protein
MLWSVAAVADSGSTITSNPEALSDAELDQRIEWLTTTLDGSAGYTKIWQYGWTSGYALGIGIGTAQAAATNNSDTRVNGIVTASKGLIGTTRLILNTHPGRLGADPLRVIGGTDRASKLQQLAAGESQLARIGERAEKRLRWQRHAGNVALNLIGGAFILGFGDDVDAAISTAVGIAVGELMIFTSPKAGEANLNEYRQQFAGAPRSKGWQVSLVPTGMGAAIKVDF